MLQEPSYISMQGPYMQGPRLAHKRSSRRAEAHLVTLSRPNYGGPRSRTARRSRCHAVCKKECAGHPNSVRYANLIRSDRARGNNGYDSEAEQDGSETGTGNQDQAQRGRSAGVPGSLMNAITKHEAQSLYTGGAGVLSWQKRWRTDELFGLDRSRIEVAAFSAHILS